MGLAHLVEHLRHAGQPVAIATLVKKEGSTYRQPGARLLVAADGTHAGQISGGCLEGELIQQAFAVLRTGTPVIQSYDLADENVLAGYGTGCNGTAHVLIEPGAGGLDKVLPLLSKRDDAVLAHIFRCPEDPTLLGARQLRTLHGEVISDARWPASLRTEREVEDIFSGVSIDTMIYPLGDHPVEIFFERVRPPIRLVVFGIGPDVPPLVALARNVGWNVCVVGSKPAPALQEQIPGAHEYIFLMHPEAVLDHVRTDARSAAVVMNHNLIRDGALIQALVPSPLTYIGVLGPRERCAALLPEDDATGRYYGPVGLDIGADTPQEIALSIIAEIQTVLSGRHGRSLRQGSGAIHHPQVCPPEDRALPELVRR